MENVVRFPLGKLTLNFGFITDPLFYSLVVSSHTSLGPQNKEEASGFHEAEARKFCGYIQ